MYFCLYSRPSCSTLGKLREKGAEFRSVTIHRDRSYSGVADDNRPQSPLSRKSYRSARERSSTDGMQNTTWDNKYVKFRKTETN